MKINGNYFNTPIGKKNIQKQNDIEKPAFKNPMQSVDSLTISASKNQIADAQFVSSLRNQISSEVKAGTSAEDIDNLSGQISRGEYEIGANEIAKRILLIGSDE